METVKSPAENGIQPEIIKAEKADHEVTATTTGAHRGESTDLLDITEPPAEDGIQPEIIKAEKVFHKITATAATDLGTPIYSECLQRKQMMQLFYPGLACMRQKNNII